MNKIKRLDLFTSNRIAAGEVVERPVSIVKELVENAIDAGSSSIVVEIQNGGIRSIRVSDNGSGIAFDDAPIAFERHATSKIATAQDLDAIETLGFRGEALCAIAAVSQIDLQSHVPQAETGVHIRVAGGKLIEHVPSGCPDGTTVVVENLFFNTPARLKFLKRPASEASAIGDYMARMMMAHPEISFKYTQNERVIYHSMGDGELLHALYCIYGRDTLSHLKRVEFSNEYASIEGFVTTSEGSKSNRTYQSFFVNGRCIQSILLSAAMQGAFGSRLMGGRFPLCALNVTIPYSQVDVNIHPNKLAVRFTHEEQMIDAMRQAIEGALADREIRNWPKPKHEGKSQKKADEQPVFQSSAIHIKEEPLAKITKEEPKEPASSKEGIEEPKNETASAKEENKEANPLKVDDSSLRKMEIPDDPTKGAFYVKEGSAIDIAQLPDVTAISIGNEKVERSLLMGEDASIHITDGYDASMRSEKAAQAEAAKETQPVLTPDAEVTSTDKVSEWHIPTDEDVSIRMIDIPEETFGDPHVVPEEQQPFMPHKATVQIIGQVFATYVMVQQGEALFFIDQHAAHERMLFDRVCQQAEKFESQQMMQVMRIQLTPIQMEILAKHADLLRNFGFDWEEVDANVIMMKSVPYIFGEAESSEFLQDVLDAFYDMRAASTIQLKRNTLAQYACKHAIKGEQTLTLLEIEALLAQFEQVKTYHCPHGRPIILRMSKKEVEKAFQRIV